jgi:hypothetical protein
MQASPECCRDRNPLRAGRAAWCPGREPFEDAGLSIELVLRQIVPDVIRFDTIICQMSGKAVQREGLRRDPQCAAVQGPSGVVVALAGQVHGLGAAVPGQNEGGKKTFIGRAPGPDQLLCLRRKRPCRRSAPDECDEIAPLHLEQPTWSTIRIAEDYEDIEFVRSSQWV